MGIMEGLTAKMTLKKDPNSLCILDAHLLLSYELQISITSTYNY